MNVYKQAIAVKGSTHQLGKCIEEMGELIIEVQRAVNADPRTDREKIKEERIDVAMTLNYLDIAFGFTEEELLEKYEEKEKKLINQLGLSGGKKNE